jgi:signal transduction histidine kinase
MLKKAATEKNVRINLAIPRYESQEQSRLERENYSKDSVMENLHEIEELALISQNIIVRKYLSSINQTSQFKSTIVLVDRQSSLIIDVKDDSRDKFTDAIGFATYTNSKSRIQSYNFIFDTIWTQAELYRKLEQRTVELEKLNIMQNEFVNIAAHELRTPTQAIVGYSEMLEQSPERSKHYEEAILRNAQRLHSLATDILDVARIESQTFKLNKSIFDLNEEVENVINDVVKRPEWATLEIIFNSFLSQGNLIFSMEMDNGSTR